MTLMSLNEMFVGLGLLITFKTIFFARFRKILIMLF